MARHEKARHGLAVEARPTCDRCDMDRHRLKAHRKRLGLSLAQAAAQVHVAPRTWARWESGERHVPEAAVHLFCALNRIPYPEGGLTTRKRKA